MAQEDILTAGLIIEGERGYYDRFRSRVMFPIRDVRGHVIGFGGRVLDDGVPKYMNTPQTPLFDISSVLYGIDLAREGIRASDEAVIVEGYMDVIVPYQAGVRNLVACMGTALTEQHIDILKRLTHRLILALDPDAAGMHAVERGVETAQQTLPRRVVPVPTAGGLIRYEAQLDAEIRVLMLPDGLDPDELILQDRARWDRLVAEALPVAEYFFRLAMAQIDASTAAASVMPWNASCPYWLPWITWPSAPITCSAWRNDPCG
jgi:DNA primase